MAKFLFDVESNGLHGAGFAVGAIVMNEQGEIFASFEGRCPITGPVDLWVFDNVLPALAGMREYGTAQALRSAFWAFLQTHKPTCEVWVDVGWPVEARFLCACVDDDPARCWEGPYPLFDVSVLVDANVDRERYVAALIGEREVHKHHPTWDAEVSGLALLRAKGLLA